MRILVLCTGNSCRSQMAAGFLRTIDSRLQVASAGTEPASDVHPVAVAVMAEAGVDISDARPAHVDTVVDEPFEYIITVCAQADERCPRFTGQVAHRLHLDFSDPAHAVGDDESVRAKFREIRDAIKTRFTELYHSRLEPALRGSGETS